MTRVDVAATRCAVLRVVSFSIVALFSLALAACGGSVFSGEPSLTSQPAPATAPVSFVQIIGAPPDITNKLTDAVNSAAKDRQISLVSDREAEYRVRGYLVAAPDAKGTKLSYIWDISDKSGKAVRRIQGDEIVDGRKGGDPWSAVDDNSLRKVALRTTSDLNEWLTKQAASGNGSAQVASATQSSASGSGTRSGKSSGGGQSASSSAAPVTASTTSTVTQTAAVGGGSAVTYVPPVTGAPGDGQNALSEAMRKYLTQQGVKLSDKNVAGAYTVSGSVQMGAAEDGQQPITIRWFVKDPSGKSLANAVVQRNKVPAGSLDGTWGNIADLAAGEAAKKVAELLPKPSS